MKFDWKTLKKKKVFWAAIVAVISAVGIVLPPGTADALLVIFGS